MLQPHSLLTFSLSKYAYISDVYGRKRAFLLAASLTTIGFLLWFVIFRYKIALKSMLTIIHSSLSTRLVHLILSRFVVGTGCAGLPLVVAIMVNGTSHPPFFYWYL